MKISLKDWVHLAETVNEVRHRLRDVDSHLLAMLLKYHDDPKAVELIVKYLKATDDVCLPSDIHPQSEWMGGDASDPKNHKLREPNAVGLGRRYFTEAEVEEARAICNGPCDWSFRKLD